LRFITTPSFSSSDTDHGAKGAPRPTGLWPEACRNFLGLDWLAPAPPEYPWTFGTRLPEGVKYIADKEAIETVIEILRLQDRPYS
jgi:hypothetical protein